MVTLRTCEGLQFGDLRPRLPASRVASSWRTSKRATAISFCCVTPFSLNRQVSRACPCLRHIAIEDVATATSCIMPLICMRMPPCLHMLIPKLRTLGRHRSLRASLESRSGGPPPRVLILRSASVPQEMAGAPWWRYMLYWASVAMILERALGELGFKREVLGRGIILSVQCLAMVRRRRRKHDKCSDGTRPHIRYTNALASLNLNLYPYLFPCPHAGTHM